VSTLQVFETDSMGSGNSTLCSFGVVVVIDCYY